MFFSTVVVTPSTVVDMICFDFSVFDARLSMVFSRPVIPDFACFPAVSSGPSMADEKSLTPPVSFENASSMGPMVMTNTPSPSTASIS